MMRIAMFQSRNAGTMEKNLQKSIQAMKEAAEHQADLILFPEVQLTEFFPQYPGNRETRDADTKGDLKNPVADAGISGAERERAGAADPAEYRVSLNSSVVRSFCAAAKEYHIMAVPNLYLLPDAAAVAGDAAAGDVAEAESTAATRRAAGSAGAGDAERVPVTRSTAAAGAAGAADSAGHRSGTGSKAWDASLLIDKDGQLIGIQKMVHIAQAPQFYEQDYYLPSDDGFLVFPTEFGRIGIVVCFDRHYPESIRTQALRGADLVLIPTANTKAEPSEMFEWEIRVQAFQNSVAVAMCNRVGSEGQMQFSGESLVADANGELLPFDGARTIRPGVADDTEQILYTDIDLADSARIRAARPYTTLRRPQEYQ